MGVFQSLGRFLGFSQKEERGTTVTMGPLGNPAFWNGTLLAAGGDTPTTVKTVQGVPAFWRAIGLVSEQIASLPIQVYRQRGDGSEVIDNNLSFLLQYEPSPLYDSFSFRESMQRNLMTEGDSFALIHMDAKGDPAELEILPDGLFLIKDTSGKYYYQNYNGKVYELDRVLHLKQHSHNGLTGQSPIKMLADALGLSINQIKMARHFYGNGAHLSGVISYPNVLSKEQKQAIASSWNMAYSGSSSAGKTAILDGGMKYDRIGANMQEIDYVNSRRISIGDISNITGVPSFLLSDLERATFSNIEHLDRTFVQYTLRSICKRWESELERKLVPMRQWGKIKIKFNLDGLLRGDTEARATLYQALFQIGAISPNEIRSHENMNAYEGGDRKFVPLNFTDINQPINPTDDGAN